MRRIREAKETGALKLDLSGLALNRLPRELASLLQSLNLWGVASNSVATSPRWPLHSLNLAGYAWGDDSSEDARKRGEVVERMAKRWKGMWHCRSANPVESPV